MPINPRRQSAAPILLLLALRGPSTPYELKGALSRIANEFWAVPHTNIYQEVERLENDGLITIRRTTTGRRQQHCELTAAGHEELDAWLHASTPVGMEIRDEAQVKLLASASLTGEQLDALAREQLAYYDARIARLDASLEYARTRPDLAARFLAVPLGRAVMAAGRDFWLDILSRLAAGELDSFIAPGPDKAGP